MATPRKRYFRVADAILRKSWSNDELAALVRLMAYLNQRWARDGIEGSEAGYAEISETDLCTIAGRKRADYARLVVSKLAAITELTVSYRGAITVILWPKFAEFQDFASGVRAEVAPSASASRVPRPRRTPTEAKPPSRSLWLNLLKGDPPSGYATTEAWLAEHLPILEGEAEAALPDGATARQRNGKVRSLLMRYWRHAQRSPGPRLTSAESKSRRIRDTAAEILRESR